VQIDSLLIIDKSTFATPRRNPSRKSPSSDIKGAISIDEPKRLYCAQSQLSEERVRAKRRAYCGRIAGVAAASEGVVACITRSGRIRRRPRFSDMQPNRLGLRATPLLAFLFPLQSRSQLAALLCQRSHGK